VAEGEGFEPPVRFPVQRFSRPPVSTTHTSLRTDTHDSNGAMRQWGNAAMHHHPDSLIPRHRASHPDTGVTFRAHGSHAGARPDPLTEMHQTATLIHMRTTIILDDELVERARALTGTQEKTALLHEGLRALIARESARRLAALGGREPGVRPVPRRRAARTKSR
jgi:Arc/MetJ family transcription regulator